MKKLLIGAVALASLAIASSASAFAGYSAIAIGGGGWGWASGFGSMESARREAVKLCRSMGGSCSASTAERDNWFYSAGYCDGIPYTAASKHSWWQSDQNLFAKGAADNNPNCYIEVNR